MSNPIPVFNPALPLRPQLANQAIDVLAAMCVFGEGRGSNVPHLGRVAIAHSIKNRLAWPHEFGSTYPGVILHPGAYDCFLGSDVNLHKVLAPLSYESSAVWDECYNTAVEMLHGDSDDPTRNAVFYFSPPVVAPPGCWGNVVHTADFGPLHFYRKG